MLQLFTVTLFLPVIFIPTLGVPLVEVPEVSYVTVDPAQSKSTSFDSTRMQVVVEEILFARAYAPELVISQQAVMLVGQAARMV